MTLLVITYYLPIKKIFYTVFGKSRAVTIFYTKIFDGKKLFVWPFFTSKKILRSTLQVLVDKLNYILQRM